MRRKIFPYIFIRGPQVKTMLEPWRDLLLPSAFHYVMVVWSSSRKSSAWGQSHHLQYSKADGSKTGIFIKLPLSVAPYSMVPSASTNRLWSLSLGYGFFFFFFRKKEGGIYWWFLEQPILNARTCGISRLAFFFNKGIVLSRMHFSSYVYLTSSLISFISLLLILRERELVTLRTLLPSSCWPCRLCCRPFAKAVTSQGTVYQLCKSSFLLFHSIFYFHFSSWLLTL